MTLKSFNVGGLNSVGEPRINIKSMTLSMRANAPLVFNWGVFFPEVESPPPSRVKGPELPLPFSLPEISASPPRPRLDPTPGEAHRLLRRSIQICHAGQRDRQERQIAATAQTMARPLGSAALPRPGPSALQPCPGPLPLGREAAPSAASDVSGAHSEPCDHSRLFPAPIITERSCAETRSISALTRVCFLQNSKALVSTKGICKQVWMILVIFQFETIWCLQRESMFTSGLFLLDFRAGVAKAQFSPNHIPCDLNKLLCLVSPQHTISWVMHPETRSWVSSRAHTFAHNLRRYAHTRTYTRTHDARAHTRTHAHTRTARTCT